MDHDDPQGPIRQRSVVVIGGGWAGVSAACALAEQGQQVTLLERRPYLGGRAFSFKDKESGAEVDNGQHVFLRCCSAYIGLLEQLGVRDKTYLQPKLRVVVYGRGGKRSAIYRSVLPAPLHLGPALLLYGHLSLVEKLKIGYAALAMRGISAQQRVALDGISFQHWLKRHGQSDRAIELFWDLILLPTANDAAARVSANQAIFIFQEGFLRRADAGDIGYASGGLSELLAGVPVYLTQRGGRVCFDHTVERLEGARGGITGAAIYGHPELKADYYVSALPAKNLLEILPSELRSMAFFAPAATVTTAPIVNVHVWYDRPVMEEPFAAFLHSPAQFLFNRNAIEGKGTGAQHLAISLSGAHRYIDMSKEDLERLFLPELARLLPKAQEAQVERCVIVKERFATFAPVPGSAGGRLPAKTPVPNLFLAGGWAATQWPSTMEGAVRSGQAAAREVLQAP